MTDEERLRQYQDLLNAGAINQDEYDDMTKYLRARLEKKSELDEQDVTTEEIPEQVEAKSAPEEEVVTDTVPTEDDKESVSDEKNSKAVDEHKKPIVLMPKQAEKKAAPKQAKKKVVVPSRTERTVNTAKETNKAPKKNHDLLIAVVVVLIVLIGGGIIVTHHSQKNAQIGTENVKKETSKKASSSSSAVKKSSSAKSEKKSSSEKETVPAQWSDSQSSELADYMKIWQTAVGQDFVGTYNGDTPQHLDYKFPDALKDGKLKDHLKLDDKKVDFTWSPKADKKADYQVVAVATGSRQGVDSPTSYFFVIHEGKGVVYATETASGKDLTLTETQNADLKNNFANIVAESQSTDTSEASEESQEDVTISDDATVTEY